MLKKLPFTEDIRYPLQQLTKPADEETQMPSYVKQIIESGMRTLSIDDFPVPQFELGAPVPVTDNGAVEEEEDEEEANLPKPATIVSTPEPEAALPAPSAPTLPAEIEETIEEEVVVNVVEPETPVTLEPEPEPEPEPKPVAPPAPVESVVVAKTTEEVVVTQKPIETAAPAPLVKKNPTNSMVKMLLISATVFLATVGIGVGLGLAFITLTQKSPTPIATTSSPSPAASVAPSPSPSPSPSPEPEIVKEDVKILVVNATTKAGYAGETSSKLKADGFTDVTARNARGEYEEGFYVLLAERDEALIEALTEATELELVFSDDKTTEDTSNQYDAVIVLAE